MLSFIYNGVSSQELGIMVNKISHHDILSEERIEKESYRNIHGSVYSKLNTFETYTLDVECTLFENFNRDQISIIKSVFKNREAELIINNKPNNILKVRLISTVNFEKLFASTGKFLLSFEVHPFSYLKSGQTWIAVTSGSNLKNEGNYKSLPLFRITGSGKCSITINGNTMDFSNVNKQFIVDTELEDIYGIDGENLNNFMNIESDFVGFNENNNYITFTGITKLEVMSRWCEI